MSLCPFLSEVPYWDACGIIQEVGGCWKPKVHWRDGGREGIPIRTAKTGINIMIYRYMEKYKDPSDPIFAFLRYKLSDEQYNFVIKMRDLSPIEFRAVTRNHFDQVIKTKKETPYVNTIGSLVGQS